VEFCASKTPEAKLRSRFTTASAVDNGVFFQKAKTPVYDTGADASAIVRMFGRISGDAGTRALRSFHRGPKSGFLRSKTPEAIAASRQLPNPQTGLEQARLPNADTEGDVNNGRTRSHVRRSNKILYADLELGGHASGNVPRKRNILETKPVYRIGS
jgi:hypothetical protein